MNPEEWKQKDGWSMVNPEKLNLDLIYHGGASKYMNKDFYSYMGSLSQPPCTEGVYRFILTEPIPI